MHVAPAHAVDGVHAADADAEARAVRGPLAAAAVTTAPASNPSKAAPEGGRVSPSPTFHRPGEARSDLDPGNAAPPYPAFFVKGLDTPPAPQYIGSGDPGGATRVKSIIGSGLCLALGCVPSALDQPGFVRGGLLHQPRVFYSNSTPTVTHHSEKEFSCDTAVISPHFA